MRNGSGGWSGTDAEGVGGQVVESSRACCASGKGILSRLHSCCEATAGAVAVAVVDRDPLRWGAWHNGAFLFKHDVRCPDLLGSLEHLCALVRCGCKLGDQLRASGDVGPVQDDLGAGGWSRCVEDRLDDLVHRLHTAGQPGQ